MNSKIEKMYDNSFIFPIVYVMKDIDKALKSPRTNVILLGRMLNILNIRRIVQYVKYHNKIAIIDVDLVGGLSHDENALKFIAKEVCADGIISTHRSMIVQAKKNNLITILKIFAYDEFSINSAFINIDQCMPDALEVLPGVVLPFVFSKIKEKYDIPINASGFIDNDYRFILQLLNIGVSAIDTNNQELWELSIEDLKEKAKSIDC